MTRRVIQGQIHAPHGAPYLLCAGNLALGVANGAIDGAKGKGNERREAAHRRVGAMPHGLKGADVMCACLAGADLRSAWST